MAATSQILAQAITGQATIMGVDITAATQAVGIMEGIPEADIMEVEVILAVVTLVEGITKGTGRTDGIRHLVSSSWTTSAPSCRMIPQEGEAVFPPRMEP